MAEPATLQHALVRFLNPAGLDGQRRRVCAHLLGCRTEAMGGVRLQCAHCEYEQSRYFSCRDRHCPQCQGRAIGQWAERQRAQILPVPYHHLVFTLPHALNGWVQLHPEVIYQRLFAAVWGTLKAFGEDPRRLGGELGMTAVLHTWGETLTQHVHLHCLLPGGALGADGRWRRARSTYLFPVRALSRHFRGRMVSGLRAAADAGELHRVSRDGEIDTLLSTLMASEWVVHSKDCLAYTATVVDYLARYTRRIAITDARILTVDEQRVTLRYTDYRSGERNKPMVLAGEEFVRRFLLHILPKGLMRVRHYGFLANRCRRARLVCVRLALAQPEPSAVTAEEAEDCPRCPRCRRAPMARIGLLAAQCPHRRSRPATGRARGHPP